MYSISNEDRWIFCSERNRSYLWDCSPWNFMHVSCKTTFEYSRWIGSHKSSCFVYGRYFDLFFIRSFHLRRWMSHSVIFTTNMWWTSRYCFEYIRFFSTVRSFFQLFDRSKIMSTITDNDKYVLNAIFNPNYPLDFDRKEPQSDSKDSENESKTCAMSDRVQFSFVFAFF